MTSDSDEIVNAPKRRRRSRTSSAILRDDGEDQQQPERIGEADHAASSACTAGGSAHAGISSARFATSSKSAGAAPHGENFSRSPCREEHRRAVRAADG